MPERHEAGGTQFSYLGQQLTEIMVMGRLMMMVRRRVVMSSGLGMMLTRRMFR